MKKIKRRLSCNLEEQSAIVRGLVDIRSTQECTFAWYGLDHADGRQVTDFRVLAARGRGPVVLMRVLERIVSLVDRVACALCARRWIGAGSRGKE